MLKAYGLGTVIVGEYPGIRDTLRAIEGIPVLLVINSIIKWVIAVLDKSGGEDMVKSRETSKATSSRVYALTSKLARLMDSNP